ncbi:MAG: hypothetical protein AMXMBFR58_30870 [Phycisphaerae bacterium]
MERFAKVVPAELCGGPVGKVPISTELGFKGGDDDPSHGSLRRKGLWDEAPPRPRASYRDLKSSRSTGLLRPHDRYRWFRRAPEV